MNGQEKKLIPCLECWKTLKQKNPPIVGELLSAGSIRVRRDDLDLLIEGNFDLTCKKCGTVLNKRSMKEEIVGDERVIKYVFEGVILGGTA